MNIMATRDIVPDITVVFHGLEFDECLKRADLASTPTDDKKVQKKIWSAYERADKIARKHNLGECAMIKVDRAPKEIHKDVYREVSKVL